MTNLFPKCFLFSSCFVVVNNIINYVINSHCSWPHITDIREYIWLETFCFEDENYQDRNPSWVSSEVLGMGQLVQQAHDTACNTSEMCIRR